MQNKFKDRHIANKAANTMRFRAAMMQLHGREKEEKRLPENARMEDLMGMVKHAREILYYLPVLDPAWEHFAKDVRALSSAMISKHLVESDPSPTELCLSTIGYSNSLGESLIEVCDAYKLGYTFNTSEIDGKIIITHMVIDIRNKDYDSPEFLEAYEMLYSVDKNLSLSYAPIYFE